MDVVAVAERPVPILGDMAAARLGASSARPLSSAISLATAVTAAPARHLARCGAGSGEVRATPAGIAPWLPEEFGELPPVEMVHVFGSGPIRAPILGSEVVPGAMRRDSIALFEHLRAFCRAGLPAGSRREELEKIIRLVGDGRQVMVDELFAQLSKQARRNPEELDAWESCLRGVLELAVIAATLYRPAPPIRKGAVVVLMSLAGHERVGDIAVLAGLRLHAPPAREFVPPSPTPGWLLDLPNANSLKFRVSICEQIWHQRRVLRRMPIPSFVFAVTEQLIRAGAENTVGIFRIPGVEDVVRRLALAADRAEGQLDRPDVGPHELTTLVKRWFRQLPEYIVLSDRDPVAVCEGLPAQHQLLMRFFVGFLQRIVKREDVTKMSAHNLGICIAGAVIRNPEPPTDLLTARDEAQAAADMLAALIERWDCSGAYPAPQAWFD